MLRLLLALALPSLLSACSCMAPGPACQSAWESSAVFLGTVVQVTRERREPDARGIVQGNGFLGTHVMFDVTEPFLGMEGRGKTVEILTSMGGGDCGYPFQEGVRYVVYASKNESGQLTAHICSRTMPADKAEEDLRYLRTFRDGPQYGYVLGTVNLVESGSARPPVSGVKVVLTGQGRNESLTTGDDGRFRFDRLPPGKYRVGVSKSNYSVPAQAEMDVHAAGCAFFETYLRVDRRITGRVTTANGMPASGVAVQMVPVRPTNSYDFPHVTVEAKTDSDGHYELRDVPAGQYYLGINLLQTPSKDMPYARYFFPGIETAANASFVSVREGAGTERYDFPLPEPQQERSLTGVVLWPDGRPANNVNIFLEDVAWPLQANNVATTTDREGHFAVTVFDRTRYRIHAVSVARSAKDAVSAEPLPIGPGTKVPMPMRLVLTTNGALIWDLASKARERWKNGLGLE